MRNFEDIPQCDPDRVGEEAHSRRFSGQPYAKVLDGTVQFVVVSGPRHIDLHVDVERISFDALEEFFRIRLATPH